MKFKVMTRLANGELEDCWTEDGPAGTSIPVRFDTADEAQAEIDEVCDEMGYDPGDYEIVECEA